MRNVENRETTLGVAQLGHAYIIDSSMYHRIGKRILDLTLVVAAGAILMPIIALAAILVRWRLGSPVVFSQPRAGWRGQIFTVHKFRSMTDARDRDGNLLPDAVRLTPAGKLLRATSLDELPQLWNVLRGDMSFVGPRPLLVEYLPRYNEEQARRHDVRPGISGWAQVNGRNAISWEEKFRLDVFYVEHMSLAFDLKILAMTVMKVFQRSDVNSENHATMERFQGTPPTTEDA